MLEKQVLLPGLVLMRNLWPAPEPPGVPRRLRADGPAPSLLSLYSDPPWYLRASWLGGLSWLPLVGVLIVRLAMPG